MKSFEINKNSLHYKIAKLGGLERWHEDICSYTRRFIIGLVFCAFLVLMFTGVAKLVVESVLSIAFSLIYWSDMFTEFGFVGSVLMLIALVFCGGVYIMTKIDEANRKNSYVIKKKPDGFLRQAYKSHKEKYCVRVEFK